MIRRAMVEVVVAGGIILAIGIVVAVVCLRGVAR